MHFTSFALKLMKICRNNAKILFFFFSWINSTPYEIKKSIKIISIISLSLTWTAKK